MQHIDSKQRHLNIGQIIPLALSNTKQPHPMREMMIAILDELSHPNVKTKQFGNTIFEVIGDGDEVFFKAFNVDTGQNYIENGKKFFVWARHVLGAKTLVTDFNDQSISRILKIIMMNPPMPGMGYSAYKTNTGSTRVVLNLGQ
jgi:hypothetical protein